MTDTNMSTGPEQPEQPPEWLRQLLQGQAENMISLQASQISLAEAQAQATARQNAMAESQAAALARLEARFHDAEEARTRGAGTPAPTFTTGSDPGPPPPSIHQPGWRIPSANREPAFMTGANPTIVVEEDPTAKRPKPRLPHPEQFDGLDKSKYPQFEGLLCAKLDIDGASIGNEREKVWYAFGRLTGEASTEIFPWMAFAQRESRFTVEEFVIQLRTSFLDKRLQQKALAKINRLKQGPRQFGEFLSEFNRLILEAQGWGWEDVIKKGYLKAALNVKLLTAMIGAPEELSYGEYCDRLRMTDDQLKEVDDLTSWQRKGKSKGYAAPASKPAASPAVSASYDTMDWMPSVAVSAAHANEPRWASDDIIEARRRAGQCLRCGRDGHRVKDCQAKLQFPNLKKKVRAAPARKEKKAVPAQESFAVEVATDDDDSSDESGKE